MPVAAIALAVWSEVHSGCMVAWRRWGYIACRCGRGGGIQAVGMLQ